MISQTNSQLNLHELLHRVAE